MKNLEIQLIRNASLKINYGGRVFLVDPVLGSKNSFRSFVDPGKNLNPTVDLPISLDEIINDVDAVLLTHTHPDHFDPKAIEVLNKNLPVYTQPVDVDIVENAKFINVEAIETSNQVGEVNITRTGGKHGPEKDLELLGQVSGFVLEAANYPSIYIIGDCIWDAEIENNIKKFSPDIIITNSGGAIFMGETRILMDEKETVKVAKTAPKAMIIAVHLEALDHCKTTREILIAEARKEQIKILVPENGEIVKI
ncbi:MAG: MBL fold metallo-hydrolase [Labilibaculum antarcticum]